MNREEVLTNRAPAPVGPYSQAVKTGGFVFCSGQIALDPDSGRLCCGDIGEETAQVMENLKEVLIAADSSMDQVVKTTIYLRDMNDFTRVNEVYSSYFFNVKPARATVQAGALPKGVNVEIDCIATA